MSYGWGSSAPNHQQPSGENFGSPFPYPYQQQQDNAYVHVAQQPFAHDTYWSSSYASSTPRMPVVVPPMRWNSEGTQSPEPLYFGLARHSFPSYSEEEARHIASQYAAPPTPTWHSSAPFQPLYSNHHSPVQASASSSSAFAAPARPHAKRRYNESRHDRQYSKPPPAKRQDHHDDNALAGVAFSPPPPPPSATPKVSIVPLTVKIASRPPSFLAEKKPLASILKPSTAIVAQETMINTKPCEPETLSISKECAPAAMDVDEVPIAPVIAAMASTESFVDPQSALLPKKDYCNEEVVPKDDSIPTPTNTILAAPSLAEQECLGSDKNLDAAEPSQVPDCASPASNIMSVCQDECSDVASDGVVSEPISGVSNLDEPTLTVDEPLMKTVVDDVAKEFGEQDVVEDIVEYDAEQDVVEDVIPDIVEDIIEDVVEDDADDITKDFVEQNTLVTKDDDPVALDANSVLEAVASIDESSVMADILDENCSARDTNEVVESPNEVNHSSNVLMETTGSVIDPPSMEVVLVDSPPHDAHECQSVETLESASQVEDGTSMDVSQSDHHTTKDSAEIGEQIISVHVTTNTSLPAPESKDELLECVLESLDFDSVAKSTTIDIVPQVTIQNESTSLQQSPSAVANTAATLDSTFNDESNQVELCLRNASIVAHIDNMDSLLPDTRCHKHSMAFSLEFATDPFDFCAKPVQVQTGRRGVKRYAPEATKPFCQTQLKDLIVQFVSDGRLLDACRQILLSYLMPYMNSSKNPKKNRKQRRLPFLSDDGALQCMLPELDAAAMAQFCVKRNAFVVPFIVSIDESVMRECKNRDVIMREYMIPSSRPLE